MKEEIDTYRKISKLLRDAANASDKIAETLEREDYTDEEIEEAVKDFTWCAAKITALK